MIPYHAMIARVCIVVYEKEGTMKEQMRNKKIRWNIAKAITCVFQALDGSKLNVSKTRAYNSAMEKLAALYQLNQKQVWILCLTCKTFFESGNGCEMRDFASITGVSVMTIMDWRQEAERLLDLGLFEQIKSDNVFRPAEDFCDSLYQNTAFVPRLECEADEIEFLNKIAERCAAYREDGLPLSSIVRELSRYESKHKTLAMIRRAASEIENPEYRFFLYHVANACLERGSARLNQTLAKFYDGGKLYAAAKELLEEKHALFKKGLLEFAIKGSLFSAKLTLSEKGRKLVFGENAFLFEDSTEDSIDTEHWIQANAIQKKKLFYSDPVRKEINRLKDTLQEETFQNIRRRLKENGLPAGVTVLLYGAPGTGKTESVLQLARETGRSVIPVDISEAKSAWFGESEKRVKEIFTSYQNACEAAEKKGAPVPILLFNEADALISKRRELSSGNCIQTENAMQNILLEELEKLRGILIATTNLICNLDGAFERRFLFKIQFEPLRPEMRAAVWMEKLAWLDEPSAIELEHRYDLSGGQIDNVVRKMTMTEVISGKRPALAEIHDLCKCEKLENPRAARRVGFCV